MSRLLQAEPRAKILSVGLTAPGMDGIDHLKCDLLDTATLRQAIQSFRPDRVYHLAGIARVAQSIGLPEYYRSNVETTQALLSELRGLTQLKIFMASSVHIYGDQTDTVDEDTPPDPNTSYGMSKYLAELELFKFAEQHPGVQVIIGRLYSCIGPGQGEGFVAADISRKLRHLAPGQPLKTGPLHAVRRFLDVRDAAALIAKLMEMTMEHNVEVVNLASPHEMEVRSLVEALVKVAATGTVLEPAPSSQNPFRGLRVDLGKLNRLIPHFPYRPLEQTVRDIWETTTAN